MSLMKKLSIRSLSVALIAVFVAPTALLVRPYEAEAVAGTVSACAAAFTASAAASAPGAVQEVVGVPKANAGDFFGRIFSGGSVNTQSLSTCILKPLGQAIVIALIRNIGASVVNWINSGFEGKPLFVTDFEGTLLDAADQAVGGFIEGSELGFLCNDFSFQIRLQLALKYSRPFQDRVTCTVSEIGDNVNNFVENNGGAGWDNWLQITTQPSNSVYGAYFIAESELAQRAARAVDVKEKRIAIGQGFLDFETCDRKETTEEVNKRLSTVKYGTGGVGVVGGGTFETTIVRTDSTGATSSVQRTTGQNATADAQCLQKTTKTPGRVIAGKLDSVLGQGEIQSAVAQEIDQVIAATLNQIAQKTIQGAAGLLGLSKKRSSSQPSYIDRYRAQYFGGALPASGDTGASSELDDYQISSYQEAQGLFDDSSNPNIRAINETVASGVSAGTEQQSQQQDALVAQYGTPNSATANAALLKPASQSSGTNPGGAVDGVTQTNQFTKGAATYNDDSDPWWEVDLGQVKRIKEVRVWKASDKAASETLGTFSVSAKTDAGEVWSSGAVNGAQSANPIVVAVNQSASAIRIRKAVSGHSCFESFRGYDDGSTCYDPLELAEVEVIELVQAASSTGATTQASSQPSGSTGQASTNSDPDSPVSVASKTASAKSGGALSTDVAVTSPANRQVSSVTVSLENSTGQTIAFSQAFAQASIGIRQDGVTRFFEPGSNGSMTFTGVSTGPAHNLLVSLSGTLKSVPAGSSYVLRVVAKGASGSALSTGTVNVAVTAAN